MTDQELEVVTDGEQMPAPAVHEPGKLMRIAIMLREMQEEVRRAEVDGAGRDRLRVVHEKALAELKGVLSQELCEELELLTLPFEEGTPTESEIRIAQAQLIGWLEGLFQGIQAAIFSQQSSARQQLAQMRERGLPPGGPLSGVGQAAPGGQGQGGDERRGEGRPGQYL